MGRATYPGSTLYDYYAVLPSEMNVKFDIKRRSREMFTNDEVKIDELGKTYKIIVDDVLGYSYY